MKNHANRFLLILIVTAACAMAWVQNGVKLGLDLAGGASLAYSLHTEDGGAPPPDAVERVMNVLNARLNGTGLSEITIEATQQNEILVKVPGTGKAQLDQIMDILERNGELEFRMRAPESEEQQERAMQEAAPELYKTPSNRKWYPVAEGGEMLVVVAEQKLEKELDALLQRQAAGENVPDEEIKAKQRELQDVLDQEVFTGDQLEETRVQPQQMEIVVFFKFKSNRRPAFTDFTKKNVKKQMAIILDGRVDSAPVIQGTLPGEGVINGGGPKGFTQAEAKELSIVLESGSTGVKLRRERVEQVGATLGKDAIDRGVVSIVAGFVAVLALMVWFYRMPGMVANVALLLNIVLLMGTLAFFRGALSLPGIAGIVLTLGMAVDANILIFERVKEERARGKSVAEALATGYDRALVAIVDANITTVLTALVLIWIGSGAVRGFGLTLTVGILASMFTAIYVTRTIFEWALDRGIMKDVKLGPERGLPRFDFMKGRRWFTGPSLTIMAVGFVFFIARDEAESKDLEFIGGQQAIVQGRTRLSEGELRSRIETAAGEFRDTKIIHLDAKGATGGAEDGTNRFSIRSKVSTTDPDAAMEEGQRFLAHLHSVLGDWMLPDPFSDFTMASVGGDTGPYKVSFVASTLEDVTEPDDLKRSLEQVEQRSETPFSEVVVTPVDGDPRSVQVSLVSTLESEAAVKDVVQRAGRDLDPPVLLSDPMPSASFLNASRAEQLWRQALKAVLLAMVLQVVYIRLRFADFKHGFAAVAALLHDAVIALGLMAIFDASGLIYAKINLVQVAAFLTLIGYSMNDTIVVFDRIRENLGRGRIALSSVINDSINQTLARSIRTSITTWVVVAIQFFVNKGKGSELEGFAFVMVVGVLSGTWSSIFIAAPLLLYMPVFWRSFSANRTRAWVQVAASAVGGILAVTTAGHNVQTYVGIALAANIPLHFIAVFIPWLFVENPDEELRVEIEAQEAERPLAKPGI